MKERLQMQERGQRIWSIVELFYRALVNFRQQHDRYESKVLDHSRATGLDRDVLRLNSAQLAGLLDFKSLEDLRDGYIHELKDLCHLVFRTQDRTDLLDRYVSDIFHEISILKEEHYTVKTYAPMYEQDEATSYELQYILDEAHTMFPQKLHYILHLFGKATERMEQHLPSFGATPIFIRSLYLHRDDFVKEAYPDGIRHFYRAMYRGGPFEGFYEVGLSFYHSGFFPQALEAFCLAEAEYTNLVSASEGYADTETTTPPVPERVLANGGVAKNGLERLEKKEARSMRRALRLKIRRTNERLEVARQSQDAERPGARVARAARAKERRSVEATNVTDA